MQTTASFQATRPAVAVRPARRSIVVTATARPEPKKQQKAAFAALAAFAAAVLIQAAPADAAEVKQAVCARNPTSRICLKDSAKN